MIKLLIFDFDGTIVDSKQVYYRAMNTHLVGYGFSRKEIDKTIDLGLSVTETLKKFGFYFLFRFLLKRKIMKDVLSKVNEIKKCKDANGIIKLKGKKILISNSYYDFVLPILKHLKLKNCFDKIYTANDFDDKAEFIKGYLKKNRIIGEECYYIGDRAADIKVAREAGCKSVIVVGRCAWDSKNEILASKPDFVINSLSEIRKIL